jgi:hypothetical protein
MVVNDFVKHAKVHYCFWDGACGPIAEKRYKTTKFDLSGRGCTNPQCVIDKIQKEGLHYDGIVYITDCQFCWKSLTLKCLSSLFSLRMLTPFLNGASIR